MFDNPITRIAAGIIVTGLLFTLILTLMPAYGLPEEVSTAISWLFDTIWGLNFVLPIPTMMQIISLYLLIDIISITVKIVIFTKNHLIKA